MRWRTLDGSSVWVACFLEVLCVSLGIGQNRFDAQLQALTCKQPWPSSRQGFTGYEPPSPVPPQTMSSALLQVKLSPVWSPHRLSKSLLLWHCPSHSPEPSMWVFQTISWGSVLTRQEEQRFPGCCLISLGRIFFPSSGGGDGNGRRGLSGRIYCLGPG